VRRLQRRIRPLFDLLLDRSSEREQPLVDRRRHLADELDHVPPVLEDPRLPNKLIAELADLRLVGRGRALQRLQSERIVADFFGGCTIAFMIGAILAYDPSRGLIRRGPAGGET
jgi:hypothetical protein